MGLTTVKSTSTVKLSSNYARRKYFTPFFLLRKKKPKARKPKPSKYITDHDKVIPFSVGQIIFNVKRPSIRRLVLGEAKLFRAHRGWRSRTRTLCWEIPVLNIRKKANNGKKSLLVIEVKRLKDFAVFSDFEGFSDVEPTT
jgi:hypothetical protein